MSGGRLDRRHRGRASLCTAFRLGSSGFRIEDLKRIVEVPRERDDPSRHRRNIARAPTCDCLAQRRHQVAADAPHVVRVGVERDEVLGRRDLPGADIRDDRLGCAPGFIVAVECHVGEATARRMLRSVHHGTVRRHRSIEHQTELSTERGTRRNAARDAASRPLDVTVPAFESAPIEGSSPSCEDSCRRHSRQTVRVRDEPALEPFVCLDINDPMVCWEVAVGRIASNVARDASDFGSSVWASRLLRGYSSQGL